MQPQPYSQLLVFYANAGGGIRIDHGPDFLSLSHHHEVQFHRCSRIPGDVDLSLKQKGKLSEAIANLERAVSLSDGSYYQALLGRAYALAGDRTKALHILDELKALSQRRYVSPFDIAVVYMGLGDLTCAFQLLEEAYQQRVFRIIELTIPMFDSLRSDSRWQHLVRRIGLS
jgi:tetratricopeptide (TPR) repeat protein